MTKKHPCPCCSRLTIAEQDFYEICPVCGWEDDPGQHENPDDNIGANKMSLNEAKKAFSESKSVE